MSRPARIEHLNANGLPRNRGRLLLGAELVARGLDGWVHNSVQTPCITDKVVLPSFQRRQGADGAPAGSATRVCGSAPLQGQAVNAPPTGNS
jgi:hypothetical protein